MDHQKEYIFRNMQFEMARRTPRGAMAFLLGAIVMIFYPIGAITYPKYISALGMMIPFLNIARIYFGKRILRDETKLNMKFVTLHRVVIVINAMMFGIAVSLSMVDYDQTLFYSFAVLCSITAGCSASIAFDKITIYGVIGFLGGLPFLTIAALAFVHGPQLYIVFAALLLHLLFLFIVSFDSYKRMVQALVKDLVLIEQKRKLQSIMDSIPGFVIGFDDQSQLMATSKDSDLALIKNLNPILKNFKESESTTQSMETEFDIHGKSHWFLLSMVRTESSMKYLMVGQPIDDLKSTQKSMEEQKAKAENSAKLATLGEMAGGIAHEINTPLGAIQLHTQMLSDYLIDHPELKNDLEKRVDSILSISERIAKIIKGLRIFARNADKDPFISISVNKIIEDTLALCFEKFKSANIKLEVVTKEKEIFVHGQDTQLCQVLLNLLNNAFDATSEHEKRWIRIEVIENSDSAEVHIVDSGHGLSKEVQKKLFQPFFTTKDIGKGTGLGLSISKGILDSHHGKLYYDENSQNTRFVIQIPKSATNTAAA